eukprot:scaffold3183_cov381-Prasinococcus_capsulatus_cf.AAC.31
MEVLQGEVSVESIKSSDAYTKYVEPVVSSDLFKSNTGFTAGAEIINCRAAMVSDSGRTHILGRTAPSATPGLTCTVYLLSLQVGALAALGAEIFGKGPFLAQLSACSPAVLSIIAIITGTSVYAMYKEVDGEKAIKDLDLGLVREQQRHAWLAVLAVGRGPGCALSDG